MAHHAFNGAEFNQFANYLGFNHRRVTPRWPQANGEVEIFMRTLKKVYRCAIAEHKCWKQEVYRFLRNYRATPHSTTGGPPATLLFGRPLRAHLPDVVSPQIQHDLHSSVRNRDEAKKQHMKAYDDGRGKTQTSRIAVGDMVLVRRDGMVPKHQSPYLAQPYKVVRKRGSRITVRCANHYITRNCSRFKLYGGPAPPFSHDDDDDIEPCNIQDAQNDPMPAGNPQPAVPRRNPPRERRPPLRFRDFVPN
ncbi:uncharacterized protein LOC135155772 [Lytechinus pictus]|uniref:uncharacterized protein LOC135155772 n=1 Tax=Lytechinus pictus TaxID=7653 RepID=UPI0030B9F323